MNTLLCPRCDSPKTEKVSDSPVKGKFEVFKCNNCNFVWRSTEDLTGIAKNLEYWKKTVNMSMISHGKTE